MASYGFVGILYVNPILLQFISSSSRTLSVLKSTDFEDGIKNSKRTGQRVSVSDRFYCCFPPLSPLLQLF